MRVAVENRQLATKCEPALQIIENNVVRGGFVGRLSPMISPPLWCAPNCWIMTSKPASGSIISTLPTSWKAKFATNLKASVYEVQIIGFAKLIGDIADGGHGGAVLCHCLPADHFVGLCICAVGDFDLLPLFCSLTSLVWQFGILNILGYGLDPLAILVPFLVFAIGVSHGVQQINLITAEISSESQPMKRRGRASAVC